LSVGAGVDRSVPEKLLRCRTYVLDDLAEQEGGDIASAMDRNGRAPSVWMSNLLVGASLSDFLEPHLHQDLDHRSRTQDGERSHLYAEIV
jgi:hypothetical protein